ncbi:MAG: Peptidoglycan glycosyltransferase [Hyphomicrobiales bacterium]|jgi:cell division protein FtsI (penicillin-binding protein 3)|nr:Peptidoglycan glycosyltransferase [Hyphomicrobiales bacterium]
MDDLSMDHNQMHATVQPPQATSRSARLAIFLRSIFGTRIGKSGSRIRIVTLGFTAVFAIIGGKLIWLGAKPEQHGIKRAATEAVSRARPDIVDRNGDILATDIKIDSVFAEPRRIIDKDEAVELLTAVLPDVNARELRERLGSRKGFVWVKRGISPKEREEVFRLGLPGVGFIPENKRVYPNGPVAAHVLGFTNTDNIGIAGIEKYIDTSTGLADLASAGLSMTAADLKPIKLSLDIKATYAVRDELAKGIERYKAKAAAAAIMDVNTGEVIAFASLPDYDPNNPVDALEPTRINRMTVGVFEMGSTFKALTLAMALDARKITVNSKVDARGALRYGRFAIHDFHAQNRTLSVSEVFTYSSNVGTARIALMIGVDGHKAFLRKVGQLDRMRTELPESAEPIVPRNWGDLNTMTIAFGHGLAVAPLQAMMAVGGLINGGQLIKPTFLMRTEAEARANAPSIIRPETSEQMRYLMRLNAEVGSARTINVRGYFPGGKTGTANKVVGGRYSNDRVFTTFTAILPADKPKYLVLTVYDEPQGVPETGGARTAAYNAGATTGRIIERVTPLLGLPPRAVDPVSSQVFPTVARLGVGLPSSGSAWR